MAPQPVCEDYPEIEKCFPYDPSGKSSLKLKFEQFQGSHKHDPGFFNLYTQTTFCMYVSRYLTPNIFLQSDILIFLAS